MATNLQAPTSVKELAGKVKEPPSRYLMPEEDRPSLAVAEIPGMIPVVDLSRLLAGDGAEEEAAKLLSALQNWGFFVLVGHGIETSFLCEMMSTSKKFFHLPLDEKEKSFETVEVTDLSTQGYGNDDDKVLDWCDRLYIVVEPKSQRLLHLWPRQPASFRDLMDEYTTKCRKVADDIFRVLGRLLNLGDGYFINMLHENVVTYARINYYPPCRRPDKVIGLKPHSDGSTITLVLVDNNVSGLQVLNNGVWYNVPMVPNAFVVNIGDVIEIMSNGIFKSPVHRVVTNSARERLSLAMLYALEGDMDVEPVKELVDDERPKQYSKMKYKEYMDLLFQHFAQGTRAVDAIKL